ncbi:TNF receptor-associated factor 6-like [Lytechinus pictus]|uniref:TNF receptor-associated factor 6-like n=1 Tax=Lytechinus pictus TaxID=7653 RepID=UPI0030B9B11F
MPVTRRQNRGFFDRYDSRRERRDQRFGGGFGRGPTDTFSITEEVMALEEESAVGAEETYDTGATTAVAAAVSPTTDGSESPAVCGYEAQFESPLDKKYVCPVCLSALRDPLQTKCGHRFCKVCLTLASGPGNVAKCPLDKLFFDVRSEVFEDIAMKREVLSLIVLCANVDCEWKGELRLLEEHIRDCPHAMIPCSNGCLTHHKRKETEEHKMNCPSRLVECTFCQQSVAFKSLSQHQQLLCPRYAIDCPLCGKANIIREDMPKHTDHKDGDCPKSMVPCKFGAMGCHAQVRRCDLQLHSQESQGLHLDLLLAHCTTQTQLIQEQASTIHELQESSSRLVGQNGDADRKIRELSREVSSLKGDLSIMKNTNYTGQLNWKIQICSRDFSAPLLSPPFYTSPAGYKLRLCLELRGHVTRSDSYTSIFIMLCKGENDMNLYFPFSAVCTLMLFDQVDCENHLNTNITCHKMPRPHEVQSTMQRRGRLQFMKTDTLINGRFCNAGTLFIRARVTTLPPSHTT